MSLAGYKKFEKRNNSKYPQSTQGFICAQCKNGRCTDCASMRCTCKHNLNKGKSNGN